MKIIKFPHRSFWMLIFIPIYFTFSCDEHVDDTATNLLEEIRLEFAPDKRVAIWDVQYIDGNFVGETNIPEALDKLKSQLLETDQEYQTNITLLPSSQLSGNEFAVVSLSVANLRSEPKHSAELSTQAIMGTPLQVLKSEGSWYLVQTPDNYISWVDSEGIQLMDKIKFEEWSEKTKLIFTGLVGYAYAEKDEKEMVSDLIAGNILTMISEDQNHYGVGLPDGRTAFVRKSSLVPLDDWLNIPEQNPENLITTAKNMMGVPYLWGGTSIKGVDCSGFTKTIYFLNGIVIPRDASQQVNEGVLVDDAKDWEKLEIGDLLFFGEKGWENQKERVVHVGMWIGNNSFIHSRGRVRISSFDPENPMFDEYELNRYLRTKRIIGNQTSNILQVSEILGKSS